MVSVEIRIANIYIQRKFKESETRLLYLFSKLILDRKLCKHFYPVLIFSAKDCTVLLKYSTLNSANIVKPELVFDRVASVKKLPLCIYMTKRWLRRKKSAH